MNLLVDIGNSTISCALNDNDKINYSFFFSSQIKLNTQELADKIALNLKKENLYWNDIKAIIISSVKPSWNLDFKKIAEQQKINYFKLRENLTCSLIPDVVAYSEVGDDFIVCAIAAITNYPSNNFIIVNLGTATTISIIENKKFKGAIIMPGLEISGSTLFINSAELLTNFAYQYSNQAYGTNTVDAINIGLVKGHFLQITGLIKDIEQQNNLMCKIIITGGNSRYYHEQFAKKYTFDPLLIFKGLISIFHSK